MSRSHDWMPQFNWPVFGPVVGILGTLLIVGLVLSGRAWGVDPPSPIASRGGNPDRNAPLPANPGVGGAGPVLVAPAARELQLRSLSARVNGIPTVRSGPGTQYPGLGQISHGEEVHVIACSPGCEWLRVLSLTEPESQRWIPAIFLTVNGKTDALPVLTPQ